jgi:hypothetical protein
MHYFFFSVFQLVISGLYNNKISRLFWLGFASLSAAMLVVFLNVPDYIEYKRVYDKVPYFDLDVLLGLNQTFNSLYGERLYLLAASIFKVVDADFYYFRFFVVLFPLVIKLKFIKSTSPYPIISIYAYFTLFFYVDSYLIRQSIASAILVLAIIQNLKGCKVKSIAFVLIASGFHVSALAAIPIVFFDKLKISKTSAIVLFGIIFSLGLIGVSDILISLLPNDGAYVIQKVIRYSTGELADSLGLFRGSVIIFSCICLFYIINGKVIKNNFKHYDYFLVIMLYSLTFLIGFNDFGVFGERMFRLFTFIIPIVCSSLLLAFKQKYRSTLVPVFIVLFTILSYILNNTDRVFFL